MNQELSASSKWDRPTMLLLSLGLALLPAVLSIAASVWIARPLLALFAVPASLLVVWILLRIRGQGWVDIGLTRISSFTRLLGVVFFGTLGLLVVTQIVGNLLVNLTGMQPNIEEFDRLRGNTTALLVGLLLVWTTAAFGEELLVRGYLMHTLHRLLHQWNIRRSAWFWAVVLSSVLFGAGHAYQGLAGGIITGVLGVGFALMYFVMRRNLWGAILTHGVYDTLAFIAVYLQLDQPGNAAFVFSVA